MAFRQPQEQEQGVPSLGYRLSSNRQPGIEQSNNMMPQEGMRPRFNPRDMPMPPQDMPMPQYERPIGRPGMGEYQNMGRQSTDPRERYIADTQGGHPNMSQYGYKMPNSGTFGDLMKMGSSMMEAVPMAYIPGGYDDDDYGSFISDSVIEMDDFGGQYSPYDEYEFDRRKGYDKVLGFDPFYFDNGMYRGGIATLKR